MTLVWCPVSSCHNSRARVEEKVLTTAAKEAAEKVENSVARMTLNASKFRKNAHIEFKRDVFSSASEISHFSAASKAVPRYDTKPPAMASLRARPFTHIQLCFLQWPLNVARR